MTESAAVSTPEPDVAPTARGDRDRRRRDVLTAATEILDESGWGGFSIRAIAARSGVSTGAVYQWFSGKDEIFGELYDREVRTGLELMDTVPDDIGLSVTVRLMMDWVVELYERLGRYEMEFLEASSGREGREIAPAMHDTYLELGRRADALLDRAAAHDESTLVPACDDRVIWVWAACVGAGERLVVSAKHFPDGRREEFLAFSAERLTRSLIADNEA